MRVILYVCVVLRLHVWDGVSRVVHYFFTSMLFWIVKNAGIPEKWAV